MAKTTTQKRLSVEEQIRQLENHRKQLIQQEKAEERKARNHRLCKRGGTVEKLLPDLITLTDEQFDIFVNRVLLSEQTKRIIAEIAANSLASPAKLQGNNSAVQNSVPDKPEPAEAEQDED